jgi:hypothetical protein
MPGKCGARLRGTDPPRYCMKAPMRGKTRCERCGGATPTGTASPHFRTGAFVQDRHIPKGLFNAYRKAKADPDLLSLRSEAAALVALEVKVYEEMDRTEAPPWGQAVEALNDYKCAQTDDGKAAALANLENVVRTGADAAASYEATEAKLRALFQERAKLVAAESRRMHEMDQFLTKERAAELGMMVMLAVRNAVLDEATFARGQLAVLQAAQDGLRRALEGTAPAREVIEGHAAEGEPPRG